MLDYKKFINNFWGIMFLPIILPFALMMFLFGCIYAPFYWSVVGLKKLKKKYEKSL